MRLRIDNDFRPGLLVLNRIVLSLCLCSILLLSGGCIRWTTHEYAGSYASVVDERVEEGHKQNKQTYFQTGTLDDDARWWKIGIGPVNQYDFSNPGSDLSYARNADAYMVILSCSPIDATIDVINGDEKDFELWWIIDHGGNKEFAYMTRGKTRDVYRASLLSDGWTQVQGPFSFNYEEPERFGVSLDFESNNQHTGDRLSLEGRVYTVFHKGYKKKRYNFLKGMWFSKKHSLSSTTWPE